MPGVLEAETDAALFRTETPDFNDREDSDLEDLCTPCFGFESVLTRASRINSFQRRRMVIYTQDARRRLRPNRHVLEARAAHNQYLALVESGESGFRLLMRLYDVTRIRVTELVDSLASFGADLETIRTLAGVGVIVVDEDEDHGGEAVSLSADGHEIVRALSVITA